MSNQPVTLSNGNEALKAVYDVVEYISGIQRPLVRAPDSSGRVRVLDTWVNEAILIIRHFPGITQTMPHFYSVYQMIPALPTLQFLYVLRNVRNKRINAGKIWHNLWYFQKKIVTLTNISIFYGISHHSKLLLTWCHYRLSFLLQEPWKELAMELASCPI